MTGTEWYSIEADGLFEPTRFESADAALRELWQRLRGVPMSPYQRDTWAGFCRDDDRVSRLAYALRNREGRMAYLLMLADDDKTKVEVVIECSPDALQKLKVDHEGAQAAL